MYTDGIAIVTVIFFCMFCLAGLVTFLYMVEYMRRMLTNFHPSKKWGQLFPLCFFIPWFFNDEGNIYRIKFLKASGLFILFVLGSVGLGLANESLRPQ